MKEAKSKALKKKLSKKEINHKLSQFNKEFGEDLLAGRETHPLYRETFNRLSDMKRKMK